MGELSHGSLRMREIESTPRNREHFHRLMAFARDVLDTCDEAGVAPVLDGSLAVFAYTEDETLDVRDIDFGCPESDFPQLQAALLGRGISGEIRPWRVLQARRNGLKIEFGAVEYWNRGIPDHYQPMRIAGIEFRVISFDGLREQYRRGAENTAAHAVDGDLPKQRAIARKLRMLDEFQRSRQA